MVENKIFLDTDTICLNENCSTTRLLTKEKPVLKQRPEYKLEPSLFLSPNPERKGEGGLRAKGYFKKSYDDKPLIAIVTVVYNGEKHLEQTINSVLDQSYDNIEYIVIDGRSNDKTSDIIKKYEDGIDYWVSEPDGGIYDAMNKGISLATGEYIAFLNADDWYHKDGVENIVISVNHDPVSYLFSNLDLYDTNDTFNQTIGSQFDRYHLIMPFGHPTLFAKRDILLSMPFDLQYPTAADYDFICKVIKLKYTYSYINKSIVNFRQGGVSNTADTEKELVQLRYKHFGGLTAIHFYLVTTKHPIVSKLVKIITNPKHAIHKAVLIIVGKRL